ncbi:MAG: hypothetical protein AB1478_05655 [Nitrospirota bacterium]
MIFRKISLLLVTVLCLSSCSVFMAAKHEGTSPEEIQQCRTRGCLLAKGVEVISSEKNVDGELIDTCKVMKKKGSTARAIMHGLLDVATLGIWEVAGTPIEGATGKKEYFTIRVYYDKEENIKKVELLQ